MKIRSILGIRPKKVMICRTENIKGNLPVFIESITEEDEKAIEESKSKRGDVNFLTASGEIVDNSRIYMFGEVNLNDKEDLRIIEKYNLINFDGNCIHSNFDYDKGTVEINKWYQTFNPILWFKYCHCLLGKPKRIIVYRTSHKSLKKKYE